MGSIVFFGGCTEEDALIADPAERLLGTWTVESASALGFTVPGDGSTISFDACGDVECTGSDYVASDDIRKILYIHSQKRRWIYHIRVALLRLWIIF